MSGLTAHGVSALRWGAVTTVLRFVLQFFTQVYLARLLGPHAYGVVGLALVLLTLATFVSNIGLPSGLLVREHVSEADIRHAFTWQLSVGALASLLLFGLAPWLAAGYGMPELASILRWLSPSCLIAALGSVATTLGQRALRFRQANLIQLLSYILGYMVVGVSMAHAGFGLMALVAAWLVQTSVATLGALWLHPHAWRPLFGHGEQASAHRDARHLVFTNLVNWVLSNVDRLLAGKWLPTPGMGVYNVAANLAVMPSTMLLGTVQPTLTTLYGEVRHAPQRAAQAYQETLALIALVLAPLMVWAMPWVSPLISLLYGERWQGLGPTLAVLLLAVPPYLALGLGTPLLWARGRGLQEPLAQLPALLAAPLLFWLGAPYGPLGLAWAVVGVMLLRCIGIAWASLRAAEASATVLWGLGLRSAVLCGLPWLVSQAAPFPMLGMLGGAALLGGLWWKGQRLLGPTFSAGLARLAQARKR